ncbi:MAG: hypothetical protein METHP_01663 [Methanoregula sp. SKADARSKE-2]|nr:MAG: hypothetical protein METHP_01663 [Methanoregula sp. SKADARSKE-2]
MQGPANLRAPPENLKAPECKGSFLFIFTPPSLAYKRVCTKTGIREVFTIPRRSGDLYREATGCFETIGSIAKFDAVAEEIPWQDFERLAAFIFEKNGFSVSVGTVKMRGRERRRYDVIAGKDGLTLLVECKQRSGNRYRLSSLKQAVRRHRKRAEFYKSVTSLEGLPIIVLLIEEEIRIFEGVPLVPIQRLDAFISEMGECSAG